MRTPFALPLLAMLAAMPAMFPAPTVRAAGTVASPAPSFAGKRVLILGDSITQDGRYAAFLEYFLQKYRPSETFDIIAAGLSSETVSGLSEPGHAGGKFSRPDLNERLERALADVKPRLVVACYGMNDGIYRPFDETRFAAFKTGVARLAEAVRKHGAELVLVTPPLFEKNDGATHYDEVLRRYADWETASPPAGVLKVADIRTPLAAAKAKLVAANPKFRYTRDGIHPDDFGHYLMAVYLARSLGLPAPADAAEAFKDAASDPLFKAVRRRQVFRSDAWRDHIGYKREKNVAPGSGDIAAAERKAADMQTATDALRRKPATPDGP